ncbi:hypothetical protein C9J03_02055 [Photobacterium gaetbulicola]|nr:hypothetical protein C9J03_02055 [Photobacterium gaetbulicola]
MTIRLHKIKDKTMKRNKATVIASWQPANEREQQALRQFLMGEIAGCSKQHQGGTGKTGMDTGRLIR